jgi:hypothetical protein
MTIISSLVRRHVSAKYSHHQVNIESKFRSIKCAPNEIPLLSGIIPDDVLIQFDPPDDEHLLLEICRDVK